MRHAEDDEDNLPHTFLFRTWYDFHWIYTLSLAHNLLRLLDMVALQTALSACYPCYHRTIFFEECYSHAIAGVMAVRSLFLVLAVLSYRAGLNDFT